MWSMSAKTQHISTLPPRPRSQSRSESLNLCVVARCQLSPAVENPNSAPAVRANVHRLSRSWLNHDSIFFRRFVFLHRIRDVGVRVCCRRLRSPIVSTGRRFPLIASCRLCVHYHVRFLHLDLGLLPFFVVFQMFYCSIAVCPKVSFFFLRPKTVDHPRCETCCCFWSNFKILRGAWTLVVRSCDLDFIVILYEFRLRKSRSYRLQGSPTT